MNEIGKTSPKNLPKIPNNILIGKMPPKVMVLPPIIKKPSPVLNIMEKDTLEQPNVKSMIYLH